MDPEGACEQNTFAFTREYELMYLSGFKFAEMSMSASLHSRICRMLNVIKIFDISLEVLLGVLIKDFEFALSDHEIVWKLGQAEAPSVDGKQMLPMIVSRARSRE